ncbi:hypothetical protein ACFLYJ_00490 [Candidatus Cloacimonadota bacterium]
MNLLKLSLSFLAFLLILSCATTSKLNHSAKEKLLIEHLENWNEFNADGIVTVNYKNFEFRKNINIKKTTDQLKITVYDSGIFGMKPEPFLTAKIDSLVHFKTQGSEKTAIFTLDQFPGIDHLLHPMQLLAHKNLITSDAFFNPSDSTSIHFFDDMKISRIEQRSKGYSIEFFYESDLSEIQVWQNKTELIKIEIDKITRNRDKN